METSGAMPQPLPPQAIIMHETEIENEVAKISGCKMCFFKHSLKFSRSILKHVRCPANSWLVLSRKLNVLAVDPRVSLRDGVLRQLDRVADKAVILTRG